MESLMEGRCPICGEATRVVVEDYYKRDFDVSTTVTCETCGYQDIDGEESLKEPTFFRGGRMSRGN